MVRATFREMIRKECCGERLGDVDGVVGGWLGMGRRRLGKDGVQFLVMMKTLRSKRARFRCFWVYQDRVLGSRYGTYDFLSIRLCAPTASQDLHFFAPPSFSGARLVNARQLGFSAAWSSKLNQYLDLRDFAWHFTRACEA